MAVTLGLVLWCLKIPGVPERIEDLLTLCSVEMERLWCTTVFVLSVIECVCGVSCNVYAMANGVNVERSNEGVGT